MFGDDSKIAQELVRKKVETALTIYKILPFQEAYNLLEQTATEVDKSPDWALFKQDLGQMYYNMAVLLYDNTDKLENFEKIKNHFHRSRMFDYQAAELPSQRMSGGGDPFTGVFTGVTVPIVDPRGPVDLSNEPSPFVDAQIGIGFKKQDESFHQRPYLNPNDGHQLPRLPVQDRKKENYGEKMMARETFDSRNGLEEAIKEEIFPCVVFLKTKHGTIGTGFFQHTKWFVSNAHVLPSHDFLMGTTLINSQAVEAPLAVNRSFHRPSEKPKSPDIVIVNITSRPDENGRGLSIHFSDDESHESSIFFYVCFDPDSQATIIKYLIPHNTSGFPLYYKCADGTDPQPGCSGAPIIEARVLIGRESKWQFRTVGVLYARCRDFLSKQKLVCAVPVRFDFEQIRTEILIPEERAARHEEIAKACLAINDTKKATKYFNKAKQTKSSVRQNFKDFTKGVTELEIALPEGLEKLVRSDEELLKMTKEQAQQQLDRAERERREQLQREDVKKKEEALTALREGVASTSNPFTDKFERDHVSDRGTESLTSTQGRVSQNRSYAVEDGEKPSSVMRISKEEGKKELKNIADALKPSDLVKTPEGYQVKKGVMQTTEKSYLTSSAAVRFSRPGHRKVDKDFSRATQKAQVAPKIENGQLKIHHYDRPK